MKNKLSLILMISALAFSGCSSTNEVNSNKAAPQRPEETGNVSSPPKANRNTNASATASPSPQVNK